MRPALALVVEPPGIEPGYPRALVGRCGLSCRPLSFVLSIVAYGEAWGKLCGEQIGAVAFRFLKIALSLGCVFRLQLKPEILATRLDGLVTR